MSALSKKLSSLCLWYIINDWSVKKRNQMEVSILHMYFVNWFENEKRLHLWQCKIKKKLWKKSCSTKFSARVDPDSALIICCVDKVAKIQRKFAHCLPLFYTFILCFGYILDKLWFTMTFQNFLWPWNVQYLKNWTKF